MAQNRKAPANLFSHNLGEFIYPATSTASSELIFKTDISRHGLRKAVLNKTTTVNNGSAVQLHVVYSECNSYQAPIYISKRITKHLSELYLSSCPDRKYNLTSKKREPGNMISVVAQEGVKLAVHRFVSGVSTKKCVFLDARSGTRQLFMYPLVI